MKKRHLTLAATLCAASMVFPGGPANASSPADDGHSDGSGTWGSLLDTLPARENFDGARTFEWAGQKWYARDTGWKPGGPIKSGEWNKDQAHVEGGSLYLSARYNNKSKKMAGSEVVSSQTVGYGDYHFAFETGTTQFDEHAIFGAFTYDWDEQAKEGFTEIDLIEASRWSEKGAKIHNKFTYYQDNGGRKHNIDDHVVAQEGNYKFQVDVKWEKGKITWKLWDGNHSRLLHSGSLTEGVPVPTKTTRMHMNAWCHGLKAENEKSKDFSVKVSDYKYTPAK